MPYTCVICNYKTVDSGNYSRHKKTKKHLTNCKNASPIGKNEEKYKCDNCGQKYQQSQGLSRHRKKCIKNTSNSENINIMTELVKHVKELMKQNHKLMQENKDVKIEMLERINNENREDKKYLKKLVTEAGSMVKTSINALTYASKYYTNAPILGPVKNYDELGPEESDEQLVDVLIFYQKQNMIAKYLGDFLVRTYKTDKPENQSMFSADVSRLNYIVRLVCGSNNKPEWCKDNSGIKIKNTIIIPMLEHIKQKIIIYNKTKSKEISYYSTGEMLEIIKKMGITAEISRDIDTNYIADNIIKYIAPHFSMDLPTTPNLITK